ncbi:carbohydrate ABC transporter permease [Falsirhodobacter halotolerans]|uniref:carbohydrate ABC transporter permease n=1 Tax=Falsirhodobacter halotolerans TaxID=1146892 RepID=UPI001FD4516C|nr:carbohydrate ABC transporter permease [Falsirhodobacter halotolerans]MCJ8139180.1 carbohydrate ABC transporter permease [Falsirhodobacter halotolerans]
MRDLSPSYRVKKGAGVIVMLALLAFSLLPILWTLILSLRPATQLFEPIWQSPTALKLENFGAIARSDFPRALMNSFITAGSSTLLALLLGVPGAFALSKRRFAGKFFASWLLLLLRMAPPVGFVIPLFLFYVNTGLIDTYTGLIVAYTSLTLPFVVWSMWTSFNQIPNELVEAGLMDGASLWQVLRLIVIPAARPGLVAAGVLSFLLAWNDFFFALVITRADTTTAPVAVMNFVSYASVDWGAIAVAALALTLPIVPVIIIANKYIVQSLGGAVKG